MIGHRSPTSKPAPSASPDGNHGEERSAAAGASPDWYPPAGRFAAIDHLRGFAALGVVLFHGFGSVTGQALWAPLEPIRAVAAQGWLGVHVFFAVSGFCIAEKLASLARRGRTAATFGADRFWRIFPPYWAALIFAVVMGLAAIPFNHAPISTAIPNSLGSAVADVSLTQTWFGTDSLLLVSWTLSCEVTFYGIAALAFALRRPCGPQALLLGGGVLALTGLIFDSRTLGIVLSQWPDFWLGVAIHYLLSRRGTCSAIAVLAAFAALVIARSAFADLQMHLVAAATAAALFFCHRYDAAISRWPGTRWLGAVGVWSFSLYLIHAPIISRIVNFGRRSIEPTSPWFAALIVMGILGALGGSWGFYRLVEKPLEARRRRPALGSRTLP